MLTMDQIHTIRELYFNQGQSVTTIAAKVGCDWRTARKYVDQEDFSPQQPKPEIQARKGSCFYRMSRQGIRKNLLLMQQVW